MTRKLSMRWLWMAAVLLLAAGLFAVAQNRRNQQTTRDPAEPTKQGLNREDRVTERSAFLQDTGGAPESRAREAQQASGASTPNWTNNPHFLKDVFTFVRVQYTVDGRHGWGNTAPHLRWLIDWPDGDLNLSYRLQQMTSIKVDPNGKFVTLNDKKLKDYPFIYFLEAGRLTFQDEEVTNFRDYCYNGGFAMFDDFWGDRDLKNLQEELKKVFPDREPVELPLSHALFHGVFDLKEKPQVPGVSWGINSEFNGKTYELHRNNPNTETVHYKAIFDDKGRIMVLLCHNTDLGDGWEREGESEYYFREFSEKKAYPMGINIIFYAMTH